MTDYSLWEVILNGNKVLKRTVGEFEQEYKPTSAEEKQDRRNEIKARGTLLMALPNKDQLKFHSYKDVKLLMEAIDKRYGGNKESKKVQRTLLKQKYENFIGSSSETIDQTFDRLQKLISQLEIQGEVITQEDINLKLLRSLPSERKTHALIWRNKEEIETISLDELYNNLKIYEHELTGSSNTSQNPQNVAFVSSNSTNSNCNSSTNEADNTAYGVSAAHTQCNPTSGDNLSDAMICSFLASQPNSPQLAREDLEQTDPDDLEEMDLQWKMAMLTIRARRFIKRTCKKLDVNGQRVGFYRSKVECYNCHKNGHFARECRAPRNQENRGRENSRRIMTMETPTENALVAQDRIRGYDWSYQDEEEHPTNYALMVYTSSGNSSSSDSEVYSYCKSCVKAYATLKEQYDNLSSDYKKSQFNLVSYKVSLESVEARLAHYKENEVVFEESINVLNFEVKLRDNTLVENKKKLEKAEKERDELKLTLEKFQNSSKSLNNLLEIPPPYTGNFIPFKPDLTFMDEIVKSENIDVITVVTPSNVKKVESNHESANVKNNGDAVEPKTVRKNSFRPPVIEDWNSDDDSEVEFIPNVKDKTVRPSTEKIKFIKSARETVEKVIRPVWNNSSRVNHKNFANKMTHPHPNRRFVPQAVLTRSGKINTAGASVNTAVRQVNTASSKTTMNHPRPISNAYKKGYSQVTKPFNKSSANKNNIFNKKVNTVRVKDTTARDRAVVSENKGKGANAVKASACWGNPQQKEYKEKGVIDSGCSRHMTGNKCYLTEYEDYDGGFVSFGDGKGRISGKGKIKTRTLDFDNPATAPVSGVTLRSERLPYQIFGTCALLVLLVKRNATQSLLLESSRILKTFITEIENQLDYKVKVIRSDNGTEFKNSVMNQFCEMKGIKREFSVARTPQQNGVAERRNRTLIEAARTMLVDSKLPTTFWAEAVNTACYVLNRVLVIKPHNKTPYELIRGRTPLIDFMKPFGCPITILNTRDHLGKFDGKADEGFFVGYYVVSKAMRVFNKRTRIVEETLNIRFLENTPNVTGNGPDWLFDVDSLTISMNYVPVVAGNQTNGIAGTRDNIITGQAKKKTEPGHEYILIPFCTTDPLISQGPKDSEEDSGMKPTEVNVSGASDKDREDDQATRSEFERILQQEKQTVHPNSTNSINIVSTPVSTVGPSFTNDVPSSPVNDARTSEEHLFE
ncbi:ribonuclease H-like domain-containing protein [Tanacetum coccineum]